MFNFKHSLDGNLAKAQWCQGENMVILTTLAFIQKWKSALLYQSPLEQASFWFKLQIKSRQVDKDFQGVILKKPQWKLIFTVTFKTRKRTRAQIWLKEAFSLIHIRLSTTNGSIWNTAVMCSNSGCITPNNYYTWLLLLQNCYCTIVSESFSYFQVSRAKVL